MKMRLKASPDLSIQCKSPEEKRTWEARREAYSFTRLARAGDASDWLALKPSTTARSMRLCNTLHAIHSR